MADHFRPSWFRACWVSSFEVCVLYKNWSKDNLYITRQQFRVKLRFPTAIFHTRDSYFEFSITVKRVMFRPVIVLFPSRRIFCYYILPWYMSIWTCFAQQPAKCSRFWPTVYLVEGWHIKSSELFTCIFWRFANQPIDSVFVIYIFQSSKRTTHVRRIVLQKYCPDSMHVAT